MRHQLQICGALTTFLYAALSLGSTPSWAQVPTNNLVAYWPFSGNANDASGSGHHGGVRGATLVEDRFGNAQSAYFFDHINDSIGVPDHADFQFDTGVSHSLSLWFKFCSETHHSGGADAVLFIRHAEISGYTGAIYGIGRVASGGEITAWASDNGINIRSDYKDGKWHHAVLVISDTIRSPLQNSRRWMGVYVDGQLANSYVHSGNTRVYGGADVPGRVLIGKSIENGTYYEGAIDDIRLYSRVLSAADVNALYTENGWPDNSPDSSITGFSFTAASDTIICRGDTVDLRLSTGDADAVLWNTTQDVVGHETGTPKASPEKTTTYRVTAQRQYTGEPCPQTASVAREVTVTVVDPPDVTAGAVYACGAGTKEFNVTTTGGTPPYTWKWSPATGLNRDDVEDPVLNVTENATYTVLVTDANGCRDSATVSVWLQEPPTVDILAIASPDTLSKDTLYLCDGEPSVELIARPGLDELFLRYEWIDGTGLDRTDTSHVTATPGGATTYVVKMTTSTGCEAFDTVVVLPTAAPEVTAGTDARICPGAMHQLGAPTNNPALVYNWSPTSTLDNASLPQPTATPLTTTTYYLTATDTVTGCVALDSVTITVTDVQLSLDRSSVDFGTLDGCASELKATVSVRNDGVDQATLQSGGSVDGTVQLAAAGLVIPPGGTADVELVFAPSEAGDFSGEVVLRFGPCGDSLVLDYTGRRATASVTIDRRTLDFGRTADCEVEPTEQTVVVRNNSTDPATIEPPALLAPYSILAPTLPTTIAPGDSIRITIGYAPSAPGTFTQAMTLPYRTGSCSDSLRVSLAGEVYTPMLSAEPAVLDFGILDGCTADTVLSVVITNPGEDDLAVSDVELPADVTLLTPVTVVPAGSSLTLQVRYSPGAAGSLGGSMNIIYGPCPAGLGLQLIGEKRGVSFAIADTLDFGELCLGEGATLPLAVLLNSQGTGNGAVVDAVFVGAGFGMDQMDWMDVMDADGAELRDGAARSFGVTFSPGTEGPVTGTLRLRLEPCGVERTVVLRGAATSVQLSSPGLDFGTLPSGTTTTGVLRYTNTGSSLLRIDQLDEAAMNGTPFTVLSTTPALPVELAAGQSVDVEVEYIVAAGTSSATLGAVIAGACDTTVVATVRGAGESSGFVRLKLPQLAGEPGELLQLTMEVVDAAGIPTQGIGFRAEVSVEPSILSVADATPWRIANNGQRVIEIQGVVRPNETVAGSVPVVALLGRVESSPLELLSIELTDPTQQLALETEDGSLEILGLCREGGVRLFDPSGAIAIKSIAPSPTQDRMTITYSLSETGEHRMMLVDAGGREVLEIFSGMFLPGTFELVRDVRGLPSGAYRLVLETPTMRVSEGVVIGR